MPPLPQLCFFDLDGTLLAPGAVLTRRTVAAVQALRGRGVAVALATGGFSARTRLVARTLAGDGPEFVWCITHNGAAVWAPDGRLVRHATTPRAAVQAALAVAGRRVWATYESVDPDGRTAVYYAGRLRAEMVPFIWGPQAAPAAETPSVQRNLPVGLEPRWDWRRARHAAGRDDVLGCWCIGSPGGLAALDARASADTLHGARYLPWGLRLNQLLDRPRLQLVGRDVGPRAASKGAAAAWLAARLGVAPDRAAAFGDSNNDLELLELAGTAIAMANGTPESRARAGIIASPSDQDGVAQVLESWLAT